MPVCRLSLFVSMLLLSAVPATATQEASAAQATDAASQREEQVRRHVLTDFRDEILATKTVLATFRETLEKTAREYKELLANDTGKRIARDPVAVMTFLQLRDQPMPPVQEVTKKLEAVEQLLKDVDAKLARPAIADLPSSQARRDVLDAYAWAKGRAERIADRRDSLQALIATAPTEGDLSKAPTLEQAINEYKSRFTRFLNEGWQSGEAKAANRAQQTMSEAGEKAALEEAAQKARLELEKANAAIARMTAEHEAELRRLREQQDQRLADLDRELAVARSARLKQEAETTVIAKKGEEDAAKILKRKKCEDPEVKALLAPFLTPGYRQPGRNEPSVDKEPMSLNALRSYGALDRTVHGLSQLTDILRRNYYHDPDRPSIPFQAPYEALSGEDMEKVKKIQGLLNELGETMVELKMLSP